MHRTVIVLPFLALAACNVSTDQANNSMTVQYNGDAAAKAANTVTNTVENVASDIGNDVQNTADKVENRSDNDQARANTVEDKQ